MDPFILLADRHRHVTVLIPFLVQAKVCVCEKAKEGIVEKKRVFIRLMRTLSKSGRKVMIPHKTESSNLQIRTKEHVVKFLTTQ
jgi:hypothetical protein